MITVCRGEQLTSPNSEILHELRAAAERAASGFEVGAVIITNR